MKRLAILMYHAIEPHGACEADRYSCDVSVFREQMLWLRERGTSVVSLDAVAVALTGDLVIPDGTVVVTFDDGYRSILNHALPVLQELELPATVFAVADRLGGDSDWLAVESDQQPLLSEKELITLDREGITIGSHSLTHPKLPELDDEELRRELADSRRRLEDLLGKPVRHLAYPHGAYDDRVVDQARQAGYAVACSTRSGFNGPRSDPFTLRRIEVFGTDSLWQFRRKVELGTNEWSAAHQLRYYWGRVRSIPSRRLSGGDENG